MIAFRHSGQWAILVALLLVGTLGLARFSSGASQLPISVHAEPGVTSPWRALLSSDLEKIGPTVSQAFDVTARFPRVFIYESHAQFARALKRLTGLSPQGSWDNVSNVVHGRLLIGPYLSSRRHRLAHVYAEWVFDRLTHNGTDDEPRPAWLYDGLAEAEAARIAPLGTCSLRGRFPIPLNRLVAPAAWNNIRGTFQAGLEYCEAQTAATSLVRRIGWARIVSVMHDSASWPDFAATVLGSATTRTP